jgi:hypothetical protein
VASSMLRFPRSKGKILSDCRYQAWVLKKSRRFGG